MTSTSKRFFGPAALTTSAATKYTAPGGLQYARITHIHVSNPDTVARTFTLSIGADAAGTRLFDQYTLEAGSAKDFWGPYSMASGEIIQALASNAIVVMEIDGIETT